MSKKNKTEHDNDNNHSQDDWGDYRRDHGNGKDKRERRQGRENKRQWNEPSDDLPPPPRKPGGPRM